MAESLVALRDRREAVIARLSEAYAGDLCDVDELDRRLDLAHAARTVAELETLVEELGAPTTALTVASGVAIDDPGRAATKKQRVIMGSGERRGRWTAPRHTDLRVFWCNAELDFRDASRGAGGTTIDVRGTMGNVERILPPELAIDVDVSAVMGSVEERHRLPVDPDPARPMLRVTGRVLMGNLEISTLLRGETKGDGRRRERRERRDKRRALRRARRDERALPPGDM